MDSDECIPVKWVSEYENAFYFEAHEVTDVDGDSFGKSPECPGFLIKSQSKCLLLDGEQFQIQFLSKHQQSQPGCKCNIQIYHDGSLKEKLVKPVMLFFTKENKKMVACCKNQNDVYPEVMEPPENIPEDAHKAVFYLKKLQSVSNRYTFQSSLFQGQYLGFKSDESQTFLQKLVLLKIPQGEVNEQCQFSLI
ncbi:interleukin-18-like [Halichoeres trimaculatus]|uniref:interleukin-18-like n=1 Tax=Halichoeres trimaculatus TaxID=147232 RepID=UPI003D9E085D